MRSGSFFFFFFFEFRPESAVSAVSADSGRFRRYRPIPADTGRYRPIPADSGRLRPIQARVGPNRLASARVEAESARVGARRRNPRGIHVARRGRTRGQRRPLHVTASRRVGRGCGTSGAASVLPSLWSLTSEGHNVGLEISKTGRFHITVCWKFKFLKNLTLQNNSFHNEIPLEIGRLH